MLNDFLLSLYNSVNVDIGTNKTLSCSINHNITPATIPSFPSSCDNFLYCGKHCNGKVFPLCDLHSNKNKKISS